MELVSRLIDLPADSFCRAWEFYADGLRQIHDHFIPHARNNYHPHVFQGRLLALMSGLLVALKIFTLTALVYGPVLPAYSSAITTENIITLTNQSRSDYHLPALTENRVLDRAAQAKADDMLAKGYFSHNTPDGKTPWNFILDAGYNYLSAGENLAVNFTEAENVEQAWMNSPGHKANILNKNFEEIGIGIAEGQYQGHEAVFVVQMFGLPVEQQVALQDEPTKVQTTAVPAPSGPATAPVPATAPQLQSSVSGSQTVVVPIDIGEVSVVPSSKDVVVTAQVRGNPVKVLALFGQQAAMLSPTSNGEWKGDLDLSTLAAGKSSVYLKAVDINGATTTKQLADFTPSTADNFNPASTAASTMVSFLGRTFDPQNVAQKFYLFFIAGMLACLILAIGVKRHIQHVSLIANGSLVIVLACLLLMTG